MWNGTIDLKLFSIGRDIRWLMRASVIAELFVTDFDTRDCAFTAPDKTSYSD